MFCHTCFWVGVNLAMFWYQYLYQRRYFPQKTCTSFELDYLNSRNWWLWWRWLTPGSVVLVDGLHSDRDHRKHRQGDGEHTRHTRRHQPDLQDTQEASPSSHTRVFNMKPAREQRCTNWNVGTIPEIFLKQGKYPADEKWLNLFEDGQDGQTLLTLLRVSDHRPVGLELFIIVVWDFFICKAKERKMCQWPKLSWSWSANVESLNKRCTKTERSSCRTFAEFTRRSK